MAARDGERGELRRAKMSIDQVIERVERKVPESRVRRRCTAGVTVVCCVGRGRGCKMRAESNEDLEEGQVCMLVILLFIPSHHLEFGPSKLTPHHQLHTSSKFASSISLSTREPKPAAAAALRVACILGIARPAWARGSMAPTCQTFPTKNLPARVQIGPDGKVRKTEDGRRIDLARDCELLGLVQYDCLVPHPELPDSPVKCWPVQRWFRR